MITQQLLDYIKQQTQQGIAPDAIKNTLRSSGWVEIDIAQAFNNLTIPPSVATPIIVTPPVVVNPTPPSIMPSAAMFQAGKPSVMATPHKKFPVAIVAVVVLLLVAGGVYAAIVLTSPTPVPVTTTNNPLTPPFPVSSTTENINISTSTPTTASSTTQATSTSQLALDLENVTPQFIDENGTPLPNYILNIKKDIAMNFPISQTGYNYYSRASNISLVAIGKRYVVFADTEQKAGTPYTIFDSVKKTSQTTNPYSAQIFRTANFVVYASPDDICTYTLDQPSCVSLPGAKLSSERYWDPMGGSFGITETHTSTSLTIGVFSNGKKVRDITFSLP